MADEDTTYESRGDATVYFSTNRENGKRALCGWLWKLGNGDLSTDQGGWKIPLPGLFFSLNNPDANEVISCTLKHISGQVERRLEAPFFCPCGFGAILFSRRRAKKQERCYRPYGCLRSQGLQHSTKPAHGVHNENPTCGRTN